MRLVNIISLSLLLVGLLVLAPATSPEAEEVGLPPPDGIPDDRPNIVVFNLDDMAMADYNGVGVLRKETAQKGAFFKNAAVTTALCCPSRVSTLTGQYVHNHGVRRHVGDGWGYNRYIRNGLDKDNLALWLKEAGYTTAITGKLMNGYKASNGIDPGWDEWNVANSPWQSLTINENGTVRQYPGRRDTWEDLLADKSVRAIQKAEKPLFLYHNPHAPHTPTVWPNRHNGKFSKAKLPTVGAFNEKDVSDKPRYIRSRDRLSNRQKKSLRKKHQERMRSEMSVVDALNRVEQALKKKGELSNTIFFFTSDNGYHLGSHRLPPGKQTPYRTDHEVPLAVWGKDVKRASRSHLVTNVDFAPTILEIAGVSREGKELDGKSFVSALNGSERAKGWRRFQLWEGYQGPHVPSAIVPPSYSAVKTFSGTILVRYASKEREFYDLGRDPNQAENRINEIRKQSVRRFDQIRGRLFQCEGEECVKAGG